MFICVLHNVTLLISPLVFVSSFVSSSVLREGLRAFLQSPRTPAVTPRRETIQVRGAGVRQDLRAPLVSQGAHIQTPRDPALQVRDKT